MSFKKDKKFGKRLGKQRYKCNVCNYIFENNRRVTNTEKQQLWKDYSRQKQTYKSLSGKHTKSNELPRSRANEVSKQS